MIIVCILYIIIYSIIIIFIKTIFLFDLYISHFSIDFSISVFFKFSFYVYGNKPSVAPWLFQGCNQKKKDIDNQTNGS